MSGRRYYDDMDVGFKNGPIVRKTQGNAESIGLLVWKFIISRAQGGDICAFVSAKARD